MSTHDFNFDREHLPNNGWQQIPRKAKYVRAQRIHRPFTVHTREGVMECLDGWLAVDINGDPYPIAADVFDQTYHVDQATDADQP